MTPLIPQLRALSIPKQDAVVVVRCPNTYDLKRRFLTDHEMETLLNSLGIDAKVITIPWDLAGIEYADDAQLAAAGLIRGRELARA